MHAQTILRQIYGLIVLEKKLWYLAAPFFAVMTVLVQYKTLNKIIKAACPKFGHPALCLEY